MNSDNLRKQVFLAAIFTFGSIGLAAVSSEADAPANASKGDSEEAAAIRLDFSLYAWNQQRFVDSMDTTFQEVPELFYRSAGEWASISPLLGARTEYRSYEGLPQLVFFTQNSQGESEEPEYRPYARVNLDSKMNKVVILLFPHLKRRDATLGQALVEAVAIESMNANFKANEPVFYNLSNREVALRYNQETQIIAPFGAVAIAADQAGKRLQLELATRKNGRWEVGNRTSITTAAGSKMMILLDSDASGDSWSIRRVVLD